MASVEATVADATPLSAQRPAWNAALLVGAAPAAALFVWLTILAFLMPMDPDEAAYAIVARGIVNGDWPYEDFFVNRQPLTFIWFLPMGLGASIEAQRLVAAAAIIASVPVMGVLARRWLGAGREILAMSVYALMLANPFIAIRANSEAFMLLPLTAALAVGSPLIAGTLFGIAIMTKLHAAVFLPVFLLVWRKRWRPALLATAATCLVVAAPFIVVWEAFWSANVTFNLDYGRYSADRRIEALFNVNWIILLGALPLWIAAAIGAARVRVAAILMWAACAIVSIKGSGLEYDHYYALLVPPAALLATAGLIRMREMRFRRPIVAWTTAIALFFVSIAVYDVVATDAPAPYEAIARAVPNDARELYVLGSRSELYEYAGRQPERRFFSSIPIVMRESWGEQARADLMACPPDALIHLHYDHFPVDWAPDLAALYATSAEYEAGFLYTEPRTTCVHSQDGNRR